MDPQYAELLREVEEQLRLRGDVPGTARETGQFLNLLAKFARAQQILEVGTGDAYATLWLAEAASATEGTVTTIDDDVWRVEIARDLLARSPHANRIRLMQGETHELLPVLSGPYHFVLLGGDTGQALRHLHLVLEQVRSGGVICCNRAISRAAQLADYLAFVHDTPGLESLLVPIGEGVEVTYKAP